MAEAAVGGGSPEGRSGPAEGGAGSGAPAAGPVLAVGDVLVDVVAVAEGPLVHGSDTAATVRITGGGSAANTAAWVAHQLCPVALCAAVGDDPMGVLARRELEAGGVAFAGAVVPGAATGTCVVLVAPDGERTMLPDRAANDALPVDAAVAALGDDVSLLHLSGYTVIHPGPRPAGAALLARARERGVPTSVDASSAGPLRALGPPGFLDLLGPVDLLFANEDELAALGGEGAALAGAAALVVKRGAAGATWTDGRERIDVAAAPAAVVDTTGAGDALAAGYLARVHLGADPDEALHAGVALAAKAVAQAGARPPR